MPTTRRQFLHSSTLAGAGLFLSSLNSYAKPMATQSALGYSVLVFGTNWGFNGSTSELCAKLKQAGYDGLEVWWPSAEKDQRELFESFEKNNLKVGFLVGSGEMDFKKHQIQFQQNLEAAAKAKPVYINCHSGKDFFSFEQNLQLITFSNGLAASSGVPIYHETHRGRALYAAPITKNFITSNSALRITLDISHWCNVHESYLQGQEETVAQTLSRTDHIHARIGHPEGPQVSDPRAPEWADAVKHHFDWWDKVVETKKKEGKRITFLTEFGPPDYMPTLPYTRQAVADQWAINVYMMEVLRKRYSA
ncbi:MAG: sugar phosphate isomerase/epimerase family protein [Cyclobacteriaceae bacterium]